MSGTRRPSSTHARVFWPRHSREQLLARLREGVAALSQQLDVRRAVLIGSWAQGRHTAASDVDLLVVYAGPARADAYALCRRIVGVPRLEPHVYSEAEAAAAAPMLARMSRGGIEIR